MRRYSQHIDEQVGEEPNGPLGPEVKAMNLPKPEKYAGEDDIDKFDEWLVQLLAYFRIFKITGLVTTVTTHDSRRPKTHAKPTQTHASGHERVQRPSTEPQRARSLLVPIFVKSTFALLLYLDSSLSSHHIGIHMYPSTLRPSRFTFYD